MTIETATLLIPALRRFQGSRSIDGHLVKKFLVIPRDPFKRNEFLELYAFNRWQEKGLIVDCYRGEDLEIIVQFDFPYPVMAHQSLRDFLLKRSLPLALDISSGELS